MLSTPCSLRLGSGLEGFWADVEILCIDKPFSDHKLTFEELAFLHPGHDFLLSTAPGSHVPLLLLPCFPMNESF